MDIVVPKWAKWAKITFITKPMKASMLADNLHRKIRENVLLHGYLKSFYGVEASSLRIEEIVAVH